MYSRYRGLHIRFQTPRGIERLSPFTITGTLIHIGTAKCAATAKAEEGHTDDAPLNKPAKQTNAIASFFMRIAFVPYSVSGI